MEPTQEISDGILLTDEFWAEEHTTVKVIEPKETAPEFFVEPEEELVKVTLTDPIDQAGKLFPRPAQVKLGRREAKELKKKFTRVKKRLIKHLKRTNNSITDRLVTGEMKLVKTEAISIIERKVHGNTDKIQRYTE